MMQENQGLNTRKTLSPIKSLLRLWFPLCFPYKLLMSFLSIKVREGAVLSYLKVRCSFRCDETRAQVFELNDFKYAAFQC